MDFLRRLSFSLWYYRHPPWESGQVPPEVEDFIRAHPCGWAMDLGCGTGTSSLALAKAGWTVTGIDFAPRAIALARNKARSAGVTVDFQVGDVTRLGDTRGPFDLVLDIGCFHGLSQGHKRIYLDHLENLLAVNGSWLLYGFFKPEEGLGPGLTGREPEEITQRMPLVWRKNGVDRNARPSAWFLFQKP